MKNISGIIMAAGRGSRLAPLTDTTPKPLMDINGKSILEINLEKMLPLVDEFVIVIGWLKEKIMEEIGSTFMGRPVRYAYQENPKGGTMQAVELGYGACDPDAQGYLIANGDNILGDEYYYKLNERLRMDYQRAFVCAKKVDNKEYLKTVGVYRVGSDKAFIELVEKPQEYVSDLVNIGLYYIPNRAMGYTSKVLPNANSGEKYLTDLFNLIKTDILVEVIDGQDIFMGISNIEDLEKARELKSI